MVQRGRVRQADDDTVRRQKTRHRPSQGHGVSVALAVDARCQIPRELAGRFRRRRVSNLVRMSSKSERRAAREAVAAYHEARLAALVHRVGEAVDRFRAEELDAFEADQVIFQYSRAAKELWKFCNLPDVEFTARMIGDRAPADWWDRGAPSRR